MPRAMNKHGFKHVRKIGDGRPKPYFARVWFAGEPLQIGGGHATAREAHAAAMQFKQSAVIPAPETLEREKDKL